jgi:hypothetical protein
MKRENPQSMQNLWADDLFPNLYAERLSDPCDMIVAERVGGLAPLGD